MSEPMHVPVLLREVVALLAPRAGETYVDCTAGLGGHAAAVAAVVGPGGTIVLNEADPSNLELAAARVRSTGAKVVTVSGNFADLPRTLATMGLKADMVLADLGFASTQVDDAARGFSFGKDGPLDMRMDPSAPISARDLVNSLPETELADLIYRYGEERQSRQIARKLVLARKEKPISTTGELAALVRAALPRGGGIDPATRTFQALRIAVNDEIGSLESLLQSIATGHGGGTWLAEGARVGFISFHSLEDRPVKRAFAELIRSGTAEDASRGVVTADENEIASNPRARSAKLRVIRLAARG